MGVASRGREGPARRSGLGKDGHLVVAELKRDSAPDTVEMQAIKYAAMASRFDVDVLADANASFCRTHRGRTMTSDEAANELFAHTDFTMTDETLRSPRIVIVAGSFPANVTATTVWLSEMGLDITLVRMQAYETAGGVVVTVSQHYPPADGGAFLVAPTRAARKVRTTTELPERQWNIDDLAFLLRDVNNVTVHMTMTLCSERPDEWIAAEEVRAATGRDVMKHRGDYGGFGVTLRARFKRSNAPFEAQYGAGGTSQQYYRVAPEIAEMWLQITRATTNAVGTSPEEASRL